MREDVMREDVLSERVQRVGMSATLAVSDLQKFLSNAVIGFRSRDSHDLLEKVRWDSVWCTVRRMSWGKRSKDRLSSEESSKPFPNRDMILTPFSETGFVIRFPLDAFTDCSEATLSFFL